jgi:molybdate transport system ATP-binding protein
MSELSIDVCKRLPDFELDVRLDVRPGETLVIVGPSGCGKTTTLNLVAGLVEPDRGRIALGERALWDPASRINVPVEKRRVGYVFQHFALFPHMTVTDNVTYGLRAHGVERSAAARRTAEVLELTGIGHLRDRLPEALSGGERQRVALARALALDPEVLLLDEPLGSLDAQTRTRVRGELRRTLRLAARVAMVVTHDVTDALSLGDRICVLDRGSILQIGSREDIFARPSSAFVAELAGTNFFHADLVAEPQAGVSTARIGDVELEVSANGLSPGPVFIAFAPSQVIVTRTRPARGSKNVLAASVREVAHLGDRARVDIDGSLPISAEVEERDVHALGIREGQDVYARVAPGAIKVYR